MERALHQAAVGVPGPLGVQDARGQAAALEHRLRLARLGRAPRPAAREQHPRAAAAAEAPGGAQRPLAEAAMAALDERRPREARGVPGQEQRAHDRPLREPRIDRLAEIHAVAEAPRQRRDGRGDLAAERAVVRVVEDPPAVRHPRVDGLAARAEDEPGAAHHRAPDVAVPLGPVARAVRHHDDGPRPAAARRHDDRGPEAGDLELHERSPVLGRRRRRGGLGARLGRVEGRVAAAHGGGERRGRAPAGAERGREEQRPSRAAGEQRSSARRAHRATEPGHRAPGNQEAKQVPYPEIQGEPSPGGAYADTSTTRLTSGGAPMRAGGPAVPKPRLM